jgi:NAD(P) transhydrogenase subunit alpha
MRIGVPVETAPGERRVSLVPETVQRLTRAGVEVVVERGAGDRAWFRDAAYEKAGARLGGAEEAFSADLVLKVRRPSGEEARQMKRGAAVVGLLQPAASRDLFRLLAELGVNGLALELVPRITRAQSIDALSSQATVAGNRAVLLAANRSPRMFPMLTTAAGTITPARVFVIGAGVAGLQAIATARRLGAVVSAFDVRPAVREQVKSLGAAFVEAEAVAAEGSGGYATELAGEQQRRVLEAIARHLIEQDVVISTAQIPGKRAPELVTAAMIRSMRPGSVIVDLAAESGGNTEVTRPGEEVEVDGVTVLAPLDLPSAAPVNASQMYSRNLEALLKLVLKDGALVLDPADEVVGPMITVLDGQVRRESP